MSLRAFLRRYLPARAKDAVWSIVGGRGSKFSLTAYYRLQRLRTILSPFRIQGRTWSSDIAFSQHSALITGTLKQTWRGTRMLKHPFEMALYPMLLWNLKPRTIIEIGSFAGGSAIWYSDLMAAYRLPCRIMSIDIEPPRPLEIPENVTFVRGDISRLGEVLTPSVLASLPRPFLVIEDASHMYAHTLGALHFFDAILQSGEYIVVEDATTLLMGDDARHDGGPARAISEFLRDAGARYLVDESYCDCFGYNVTGNPNGYLKRI